MIDLEFLRKNPPPNAGQEYVNPDGLIKYLSTKSPEEIKKQAEWIKMHYVNTDYVLSGLRKIYARKTKK